MQGSSRVSDPGESPLLYPDSKIEIRGVVARHYDILLDLVTLGWYRSFLNEAIAWMEIRPADRIVDLGAGTGRNACLMARFLSPEGRIVGIDIGLEMMKQFTKHCRDQGNVTFLRQRIDVPFHLDGPFDKALLSFVLHGFPHDVRETILKNCFSLLAPGGWLVLFDYNEFSLSDLPWYLRVPFKVTECPYAFDFIERDWTEILADHGFAVERSRLFMRGMIRCLSAVREGTQP